MRRTAGKLVKAANRIRNLVHQGTGGGRFHARAGLCGNAAQKAALPVQGFPAGDDDRTD